MTGRLMAPMASLMAFATVYAMSRQGMKGSIGTIWSPASASPSPNSWSPTSSAPADRHPGGLVCLMATAVFLKFQKQFEPWLFEASVMAPAKPPFPSQELFLSWLPYLLLAILVILTNLAQPSPRSAASRPAGTRC